jgi:hypothetical protein
MLRGCSTPAGGVRSRPYRPKWKRAPAAERGLPRMKFRNACSAATRSASVFCWRIRLASGEPALDACLLHAGRMRFTRHRPSALIECADGRRSSARVVEDATTRCLRHFLRWIPERPRRLVRSRMTEDERPRACPFEDDGRWWPPRALTSADSSSRKCAACASRRSRRGIGRDGFRSDA